MDTVYSLLAHLVIKIKDEHYCQQKVTHRLIYVAKQSKIKMSHYIDFAKGLALARCCILIPDQLTLTSSFHQ